MRVALVILHVVPDRDCWAISEQFENSAFFNTCPNPDLRKLRASSTRSTRIASTMTNEHLHGKARQKRNDFMDNSHNSQRAAGLLDQRLGCSSSTPGASLQRSESALLHASSTRLLQPKLDMRSKNSSSPAVPSVRDEPTAQTETKNGA